MIVLLTKIYMYKCNVTYEIVYNIQDINITNNIINIIRCTQNGILSAFHSQDDVCRNITLDLNRQKYSFSIENNLPNAILLRKITHVLVLRIKTREISSRRDNHSVHSASSFIEVAQYHHGRRVTIQNWAAFEWPEKKKNEERKSRRARGV